MSIVVTGASGALGTEVVRHLVRQGQRVAAIGTPHSAAVVQSLAKELGPSCLPIADDTSTLAAFDAVVARIEKDLGAPAGAVLVAGGWRGGTPFYEEKGEGSLRAMIATNLETAERALRALLPGMVARKAGSVLVVGSRAGLQPWTGANAAAYAASKAALVALAQAVAAEVRAHGVRVNAICPSTIDTPANRAAMPSADTSAWVSTHSLASLVAYLLGDDARDVTGAAIPVFGRT